MPDWVTPAASLIASWLLGLMTGVALAAKPPEKPKTAPTAGDRGQTLAPLCTSPNSLENEHKKQLVTEQNSLLYSEKEEK